MVNQVDDTTDAHISSSTINSATQQGEPAIVEAHQQTNITSGSGVRGRRARPSVGAAIDAELLGSNTDAFISNSTVYAATDVYVSALTRESGPLRHSWHCMRRLLGLAGGASDVDLTGTTQAYISDNSTINTAGDLTVTANDGANLTLGVGFLGGAGGLAFGGAIALGMDSDQTSAHIADSTTNASGNTSVEAVPVKPSRRRRRPRGRLVSPQPGADHHRSEWLDHGGHQR